MLSNLSIRVQNYKSYLDSEWVSLDGKNVLIGIDNRGYSNGSGKSSILDALTLFLDNNWETYNKTEVRTLTNVNTPKKEYIIISLKCNVDGELFEAQIDGSSGFLFTGDKSKLNKFQQELTGAVMTQGLINNLADFEKRSELDNYIDRFYNVKEIIVKLKDFQKDTASNLGKKVDEINVDITKETKAFNKENENFFTAQGQIELYKQYAEEDITTLEEEFKTVEGNVNDLYEDFPSKRTGFHNEKHTASNRISELSNVEAIKQRLEKAKKDKESFINSERTKYLSGVSRQLTSSVNSYVENVGYLYGMNYNNEVEKKKKDRLAKITDIQTKINGMSLKTPDYVLTAEEIEHVNKSVIGWVPKSFKLGDTYKEVTTSLNTFIIEVKKTVEEDSQAVVDLRKELQEVPPITYTKTAIQKRAETLSISSDMKKYAPVNKPTYYVYWEYLEEELRFDLDYKLPSEFEKSIDVVSLFNQIAPFSYETSGHDTIIENIEKELKVDTLTELNTLNARVKEIDKELTALTEKELDHQKELGYKQGLTTRITGCKNYLNLSSNRLIYKSNMDNLKITIDELKANKDIYVIRQNDTNKLIDNISRFSGEELRNEFGFKLAKLSSVILNDIFNLEGELMLESNGLRTTFKYNDGNGFLSFKVLSGGQLQKIKIAINLALLLFFYKDRQYIFLDEVFQHLDNPSKGLLINYIVKDLGIKNILLIQHDSLKFDGFKEIAVYRDEHKNTRVVR